MVMLMVIITVALSAVLLGSLRLKSCHINLLMLI